MKEIRIGAVVSAMRKQRGITQEELADFLGVSKPAVSKWESGQSYPDITLLPRLAAYFSISVDQLLDYEPQMDKEEIRRLYIRLSEDFAREPFETVRNRCLDYAKRFYSCWRLVLHMGLLLLNHAALAANSGEVSEALEEAALLFHHVWSDGDDEDAGRQARSMEAYCCLILGRPDQTISLLDNSREIPLCPQVLLAKAYGSLGDLKKGKALLQERLYMDLVEIFNAGVQLFYHEEDGDRMKTWYARMVDLADVFALPAMHPSLLLGVHIAAAQCFAQRGYTDDALLALERYVDLATSRNTYPLQLKGDEYFDSLDELFAKLDLGTAMPRNEDVVVQDIKKAVLDNPEFAALQSDSRFHRLAARLRQL